MKRYTLGTVVTIDGVFRAWDPAQQAWQLADPTELRLILSRPGGSRIEEKYGIPIASTQVVAIERTGDGTFYADVKPDISGKWVWRWEPTGDVEGAEEGEFFVESAQDQPLDILIEPEDYDGIRAILGVTSLDVKDRDIESTLFGRQAELRTKMMIPEWEALKAEGDDEHLMLRTIVAYMTAALIAESAAKGGFLGLARPEGGGRDWDAEAALLWGKVEQWGAQIAPGAAYDLPMIKVARPIDRRARGKAAPRWADGFPAQWGGWK